MQAQSASSGTSAVSAGLCCNEPALRQLKQRFVFLLLCLGKKSMQMESCPLELAWLLVPGVDCGPCHHAGLLPDPVLSVACMARC